MMPEYLLCTRKARGSYVNKGPVTQTVVPPGTRCDDAMMAKGPEA